MFDRAKRLGRTHFSYTDHGHLSSCLKSYLRATKAGMKFIPGIEVYFKDNKCPIISGTSANRCKYFSITLYCKDQEAYQELCKMVSNTDMPTIKIHEETQQLWSWPDLKKISKFNVVASIGGIHCMVGKTMLAGHPNLAEMILVHLKDIFKQNLYVSLFCEPWTKRWCKIIEIELVDNSKRSIMANDLVTTERARRIKAIDLVEKGGHNILKAIYSNSTYQNINLEIKNIKLHKGFLPLPGGDVSFRVNKFLKALAKKHNVPIMATDYAYYANKEDKVVQTMVLEGRDKLYANLHMKSEDEILQYLTEILKINIDEAKEIIATNDKFAELFDNFKLNYEWRLADVGESPIKQAMEIIKQNGRMKWDDPKYIARLREELEVIAKNPKKDLTAYFLPIRDVLNYYKEHGQLTGPGRGSAGGSLFCYLLGITQIDPFKYDLPFNRFFSLDRVMLNELPDIDVDLEDRELLIGSDGKSGYLYNKYGDKAAQISTRTTIRLKSAIKDTNRYFNGKVEQEIETLTEGLPAPPQGISDHDFLFGFEDKENGGAHVPGLIEQSEDIRQYIKNRPKEWDIVNKAMGITRSFSKHASAFVLSDIPIKDIVPVKDGYITQYEAKEVEAAKLIKYDFLVVTQLKDIRVCLDLINQKHNVKNIVGYFPHNDKLTYIWDLPENPEVFKSIWTGACETLFQINTKSMIPFVMEILPKNIMDLATILALVRPGPMDFIDPTTGRNMVEEYTLRRCGKSKPDIQTLADLLPETYGIIIFQEQLTKIGKNLAGFPGPQAEMLRKHMAKKNMAELMKMKPAFIEGAKQKVDESTAEAIWERMVTFGRYGFSVIHAVEYAHITYACMFLKHYYPLEWWAAILTNAEEREITGTLWPFVKDKILPPDINLSTNTMVVDYNNNKIRAKLGIIRGIGETTIEPIIKNRTYKNIQDFVNKNVAGPSLTRKLIHVGVLDSLFPPKTSFIDKLKMFEDAMEIKKYMDKKAKADKIGKKLKMLQPKEGQIPKEYLNMTPLKDAAMRKSVLPSLPIDLYSLGQKYSKLLKRNADIPTVISPNGYDTVLIDGRHMEKLDKLSGDKVIKDIYVASTCFVIEAKEFSYPNRRPTKRALKLILDSDGYISEKVLWPNYNTGELIYPRELSKGSIVTVFFKKRAGDDREMNVMNLVVEA